MLDWKENGQRKWPLPNAASWALDSSNSWYFQNQQRTSISVLPVFNMRAQYFILNYIKFVNVCVWHLAQHKSCSYLLRGSCMIWAIPKIPLWTISPCQEQCIEATQNVPLWIFCWKLPCFSTQYTETTSDPEYPPSVTDSGIYALLNSLTKSR